MSVILYALAGVAVVASIGGAAFWLFRRTRPDELVLAIRAQDAKAAKRLLKTRDSELGIVLVEAIEKLPALVPKVLKKGVKPGDAPRALLAAVQTGNRDLVDHLIALGWLPGPVDDASPLEIAADADQAAIVDLLLAAGAQPTTDMLHRAVERGSHRVVKSLLEAGADGSDGLFHLPKSFMARPAAVASLLLDAGASPNRPDDEGRAPLHHAAACDAATVRLLLRWGAEPSSRDRYGDTALLLAAGYANVETLSALAQGGARLVVTDAGSNTPLHRLFARPFDEDAEMCAEFLIDAGADLAQLNDEGLSAIDVLERVSGTQVAARVLAQARARQRG